MTVLEESIQTKLLASGGLTALTSTRIYPVTKPQAAALPCVVYERISTPRMLTHDSTTGTDLASPRFQFDVWATTLSSCKAVIEQLRTAIHALRTITGLQVALALDERMDYEPETELYHGICDYTIWNTD